MVGIYIRKSRDSENEKSIKEQRKLGIEFAESKKIKYELYDDGIISGTIIDRPEFARMINDIKSGKLKSIFIWNSDRAARDEMAWQRLAKSLKVNNCLLYDNGVEVDLNNENNFLFYTMKSAMDAHFARVTSSKIKTVLLRNAKEGKAHGKIMPFGYMKDKEGFLVINPEEKPIVKKIYEMSLKGKGYQTIANWLNDEGIPTRYNKLDGTLTTYNKFTGKPVTKDKKEIKWVAKTVSDIIKNPIYKGKRKWKEKYYEIEAIFNEEYWSRVNENLNNNKSYVGKQNEHDYLLNRLLECGVCGKNYNGRKRSKSGMKVRISENGKKRIDRNYYTCGSKRVKGGGCGNKNIMLEPIEEFIWKRFFCDKFFLKLVDDELSSDKTQTKLVQVKKNFNNVKKELNNISNYKNNLVLMLAKELINENDFIIQKDTFEKQISDLEIEEAQLKAQIHIFNRAEFEKKTIKKDFNKLLLDTDFKTKKELINKYLKRIFIRKNDNYKIFELGIEFNLPLKWEYYWMSYDYNIVINLKNKDVILLNHEIDETWLINIKNGIKKYKFEL